MFINLFKIFIKRFLCLYLLLLFISSFCTIYAQNDLYAYNSIQFVNLSSENDFSLFLYYTQNKNGYVAKIVKKEKIREEYILNNYSTKSLFKDSIIYDSIYRYVRINKKVYADLDSSVAFVIKASDTTITYISNPTTNYFFTFRDVKKYEDNGNQTLITYSSPRTISIPIHFSNPKYSYDYYLNKPFELGRYYLFIGEFHESYNYFKLSYYHNDKEEDYLSKKAAKNNANSIAVVLNKGLIDDNLEEKYKNKTARYLHKYFPYFPSLDSIYTIKSIRPKKNENYYIIKAKSNYGKTYNIISFKKDTLNKRGEPLKVGKKYKLNLKNLYLHLFIPRPYGNPYTISYILGEKRLYLTPKSNYFFAENIDGINYVEDN